MTRDASSRLAAAGAPVRLALFYAACFLVVGILTPFWPVWLAGRGLTTEQIALVFAVAIWVKVVATPPLGALADRLGRRRGVMVALAAIGVVAYALLWPAQDFASLFALNVVAAVALGAVLPLGDSITLAAVRASRLDYGRIRVWGSVSFIAAAVLSGAVLAAGGPAGGGSAGGGNRILLLTLAASTLLVIVCLRLPAIAAEAPSRGGGLRHLAADPRFRLFVATAAALQASHQLYYGFGTLYWRRLGFSDPMIGALWAEGVVAEILLFWKSAPILARCGPLGLMALGGAGGILRWGLSSVLPFLPAVAALQLLHALSFGASHLGAMHYIARTVPPRAGAGAQSLYAAVSSGFGGGLVMLAAGALYARFGGLAYLSMAVLSALGLLGSIRLAAGSTPAQQAALAGGQHGADREPQH